MDIMEARVQSQIEYGELSSTSKKCPAESSDQGADIAPISKSARFQAICQQKKSDIEVTTYFIGPVAGQAFQSSRSYGHLPASQQGVKLFVNEKFS
eukprot:1160550-Pelagomonas_calceolata.AAC.3